MQLSRVPKIPYKDVHPSIFILMKVPCHKSHIPKPGPNRKVGRGMLQAEHCSCLCSAGGAVQSGTESLSLLHS